MAQSFCALHVSLLLTVTAAPTMAELLNEGIGACWTSGDDYCGTGKCCETRGRWSENCCPEEVEHAMWLWQTGRYFETEEDQANGKVKKGHGHMCVPTLAGVNGGCAPLTVLFTEDFECPVVDGYDKGSFPSDWVRSEKGYKSDWHGLCNNDNGCKRPSIEEGSNPDQSFTTYAGAQAYLLDYTNAGLTTKKGVMWKADVEGGCGLQEDVKYTVSFTVATFMDPTDGDPNDSDDYCTEKYSSVPNQWKKCSHTYRVELVAFDNTDVDRTRNEVRVGAPGTVLLQSSGAMDSKFMRKDCSFTAEKNDPWAKRSLGKELGLRLVRGGGASGNVLYDNMRLTSTGENPGCKKQNAGWKKQKCDTPV